MTRFSAAHALVASQVKVASALNELGLKVYEQISVHYYKVSMRAATIPSTPSGRFNGFLFAAYD